MNKTRLTGIMLSTLLVGSSILFVSLVSENKAEASILKDNEEKSAPCQPPCIDEAKKHLDEAKKSLDAGDTEGAKTHIDKAKESLGGS
ncbi:MAG: hypothetical protein MRJ93_11285 [Nitrososphaeraceae archaeon]|nr:hypothetical protein [Nitrososphaeraceae archaeon]